MEIGKVPAVDIEALVVDKQLLGFDLLLGIDAIKELGSVYVTESDEARFGGLNRYAAISIDEPDFSVTYDRSNKEWTESWKWANGRSPSELSNSVLEYTVPCHARDSNENEILQWWQQGVNVPLLDLRNAYLQIHSDKALWPFQTVIFRGQRFCLTRFGFGLNVAPLIMKSVIDAIVSQDHTIKSATSAYVDDILMKA